MQAVYVIDKFKNNLLGLPAIKGLKLFLNVCSIQKSIMSQYPLLSGLGMFTQEYKIKLDTTIAKPFALSTPRNIPLPLTANSKGTNRAETHTEPGSYITHERTYPLVCCNGGSKDEGAVQIFVDLKPLNVSILREVHPMPKVDTTLAQLSECMAFSKLDAKSGFWIIPLAAELRL